MQKAEHGAVPSTPRSAFLRLSASAVYTNVLQAVWMDRKSM